jgi:membrane protein HdeD
MTNWVLWLLIGIITVLGGIFALLNPFAATLAATTLAAWVFIIAGALQLLGIFQTEGWGARIWGLILALAFIWLGISILGNPLAGMMSLTIVAGIMFLATGIAKIIFAFRIRGSGYFIWALLSGLVSLILGVMVFTNFPYSAAVVLGVLLAVELISSGITLVTFALLLKNSPLRKGA